MKTRVKKTKLTLTVSKSVIEKAREVFKNKSLSKMVEDYLADRIEKEGKGKRSVASKLRGCAEGYLSALSDREIKELMVREKYGR